VQLAFAAVAASAIVAVVFALVSRIPENLDIVGQASKYFTEIQSFLKQAGQTFVVFRLLTAMITGNEIFRNQRDVFVLPQIATLGIYILVLAGIAAAAYFIERKLFFYMASRPNEHRKRLQKERGNRTSGVLLSAVKKETLSFVRSPAGFFANYIMVFALPFAIYLLNKIFASMHTRLLGDQLAMGFNILMILLIMMSTNMSMASVFSSDGKAAYSLKTNPQTLRNTVISKTVIHFALTLISLGVTAVIVYTVAKFSAADTVFLFFSMLFINIGHVFWSVEMDIVKPQYNKYFGGVHIGANPNEVKSVAAAFIISFAFFGVSLFFFTDKMSVAWIKLTLIAAAFLGVRIWLLINRGKVYFGDF
ncbi:MAG: hypothetical protein LBS99_03215, partial [Clostridiales bacterium]|jgi:hypothetical protein|nr:hypothetical protein [Clostridiales bacterium]